MDNQEMMNQIAGMFEQQNKKFDAIDKRFDEQEARTDKKFEQVTDMFKMQTELILGLDKKIDNVRDELKADIKSLDNRLSKVELTIEHEIRDNIQILVDCTSKTA